MLAALRAVGAVQPGTWAPVIAAACRRHGIDTLHRVGFFLGNIAHESNGLRASVESLNYTVEALLAKFGRHRISREDAQRLGRVERGGKVLRPADEQAIANILYGGEFGRRELGNTQPNDGWFFRGAGPIQLTGRRNHTNFARSIGIDVVALQKLLHTPEGGIEAAARFWIAKGCNAAADAINHAECRRLVNGGQLGLEEVRGGTLAALDALRPFVP